MPELATTSHFRRAAGKLPSEVTRELAEKIELLRIDPFHPLLHTKALSGKMTDVYSFRIGRDWRALFEFMAPDGILLTDVAHRKDIYR